MKQVTALSLSLVSIFIFFFTSIQSGAEVTPNPDTVVGHSPLFEYSLNMTIQEMENPRNSILGVREKQNQIENAQDCCQSRSKRIIAQSPTFDVTCGATCGATCTVTCSGPTCFATCDGPTCGGATCYVTCEGVTCGTTCGATCGTTCDGPTCGTTCDGPTCGTTCDGPTCGTTCDGPTCDGPTCGTTCDTKAMPGIIPLLLLEDASQVPQAKLRVSYDPNPVPVYTGNSPCFSGTEWHYTVNVSETAGVGLTVDRWTADFYDQNGDHINQLERSSSDFADRFNDCGPGSASIAPNSTVCSDVCATLTDRPSGSIVYAFYGTDTNGNSVSQAARVIFSAAAASSTSLEKKEYSLPRVKSR